MVVNPEFVQDAFLKLSAYRFGAVLEHHPPLELRSASVKVEVGELRAEVEELSKRDLD